MVTYRRPTTNDLEQILLLAREMHAETSFRTLSFNEAKAATEILSCIVNPLMFVYVAEKDGEIVGVAASYLSQPYFSEDWVAYDHIWFVGKTARGSMVGPGLLKHMAAWAKFSGAKALFVTLGSDVSSDRVGALVERLGFSRLGGYYRKDLEGV